MAIAWRPAPGIDRQAVWRDQLRHTIRQHLMRQAELTRRTLAAVLAALPADKQRRAVHAPERWARIVATTIRVAAIEAMVEHIAYEPMAEADWYDAEVVFLEAETVTPPAAADAHRGVEPAPDDGPNLYDHLVYDSEVERQFAAKLEHDERVRFFTKLPRRFRVRTPVGDYAPDWAVVYDDGATERLYLIRETKDTLNLRDLAWDEAMRIRFGGRRPGRTRPLRGASGSQVKRPRERLRRGEAGWLTDSPATRPTSTT
jgi:type III restriction enzyme